MTAAFAALLALALAACGSGLRLNPRPPMTAPPGQPFTVEVELENAGTAATTGQIQASIAGAALAPVSSDQVNALPPGQRVTAQFQVDGLARGAYRVRFVYRDTTGAERASAEVPFEILGNQRLARYNEVYQVATHNSYWVKRDNVTEVHASGVQQRLLDQLAFEGARTFELDIHKAGYGEWEVYHNEPVIKFKSNSLCVRLEDCLRHLELFHYAVPNHEVVTVVLELKDFDAANFDDAHTVEHLDAQIEARLGPWLYRPADQLARCREGVPTLRACVQEAGWPVVHDLRGKFVFAVLGNWRGKADHTFNYYGQGAIGWVRYATEGGGVRDRAAFPMATDFGEIRENEGGYGASAWDSFVTVPPGYLQPACDASVFLQAENGLDHVAHCGKARDLLATRGIIRAGGAEAIAFSQAGQGQRVADGIQMLQTDHPWHVFDDRGPAQPLRVLPGAGLPAGTQLVEPGIHTLFASTLPIAQTRVFSYTTAGDGDWIALVGTTRPATDATYPNPAQPRGVGCLRAQVGNRPPDDNRADYIAVCRWTKNGSFLGGPGENAMVTVEAVVDGAWRPIPHDGDPNGSNGIGELVKLSVRGRCATVASASEAPHGAPTWRVLTEQCFRADLTYQGVTADTGDVVFLGLRRVDKTGVVTAVRGSLLTGPVLIGTFGQVITRGPGTAAYRVSDPPPAGPMTTVRTGLQAR